MPRKPFDDSNSPPSGGRRRASAGRSSDRATRPGRSARAGAPGAGRDTDRVKSRAPRDPAGRGNSVARGESVGRGKNAGRSDSAGRGDRAGRTEARGTADRKVGAGRPSRDGFTGRGRGGDRGTPRAPREGFTARGRSADRAVPRDRTSSFDPAKRAGPSESRGSGDRPRRWDSADRAGGNARPTRRGPNESGVDIERRGQPGPRSSGVGGDRASRRGAGSSVWDSAPGRRKPRPSGTRAESPSRGDNNSAWAGASKGKGGRGKRERAPGDRKPRDRAPRDQQPRPDRPQASPESEGQTPAGSWSGSPPVQQGSEPGQEWDHDAAPSGQEPEQQKHSGEPAPQRRDGREGRREGRDEGERLQKVLSRAGVGSRREVEDWIRAGRISVNDKPAVLGVRVGPSDRIRLDGRLIRQREVGGSARVFLIHRSPGENLQQPVETSDPTDDSEEPPAGGEDETHGSHAQSSSAPLLDRMPRRAGRRFIPVSPMPRVDGGLELVTSDGDLASKLQRSMRRLASEFSVRVHGELSPQGLETISQGVLDTGEKLQIERCEAAGGEGSNRWYSLVARGASGKDVRQLFERQGALVSRVLRTQLGSLALDRLLSRGRFRELTAEELEALLAAAEGSSPP